ncbi:outer membrane protein [Porphyrobacter sp. ULC335]|uniref:outer membrane protein n=1 Tax=Porphyrobacter sp. ULC335 TaxID=2854260 RepID=UPI00221E67BA|nr:outer membrane beta-barrel protein [Porphyrobacter sp. ULC335]UYV16654.1 outer membrane beta-barrel protein [Porphyrobacter sp. ULC335]
MKPIFLAATASTILVAVPVNAEDEFEGFYAGASIGYDFQASDGDEFISFDRGSNGSFGETVTTAAGANAFSPGFCGGAATSPQNANCESDSDGVSFNGHFGYDSQMGKLVVGLVGEVGTANVRDAVSAFSTTPAFYYMEREIDYTAALRLRAGYTPATSTLVYLTGGLAYAKLDQEFETSNTANSFTVIADDKAWGYQLGAGIEQKVGKAFSIGIEYLYTGYNDDDTLIRVGQGTAPATNPFVLAGGVDFKRANDDFNLQTVKAVVRYRF